MTRNLIAFFLFAGLAAQAWATQTLRGTDQAIERCWLKIVSQREDIKDLCPEFSYHYAFSQYLTVETNYFKGTMGLGPKLSSTPDTKCGYRADFKTLSGVVETDCLDGSIISGVRERFELVYEPSLRQMEFTRYAYHEDDESEPEKWLFLGRQVCRFD